MDAYSLTIIVYNVTIIPEIEKGIHTANLGFNPMNNGERESSGRPTLQPSVSENIKNTNAKVPAISARNAFIVETATSYPKPGFG